jgi:FkbM family methyltransferase
MRVEQYHWHSYLPDIFDRNGVAFDLGANHFEFAARIARTHRRVIALEPNPDLQPDATLPDHVEIIRAAIYREAGRVAFRSAAVDVFSHAEAVNGADGDAGLPAMTLSEALALAPDPVVDFVKMDIENEELWALEGASDRDLQRVRQMTVEFHDFLHPEAAPRIQAIIRRMEGLGFWCQQFSLSTYGDVLFVNRRHARLSFLTKGWIALRYKWLRGLGRKLARVFGRGGNLKGGYRVLE